MARFRKGTLDHDGDGRKGGSLKGDADMVKVKGATAAEKKVVAAAKKAAKAPAKAKVAPKVEAKPAAEKQPQETPEQAAAKVAQADLEASVGRHPGGMEPPLSLDEQRAQMDAAFAEADGKGDPRWDETLAGLQVRGY